MSDTTIPANKEDFPETSQVDSRFFEAGSDGQQEPPPDAKLGPAHQKTPPGRRPLFRR